MSRQFCLRTEVSYVVSCYRGMATDTIHLSLSNWMGEKEGIDRMVGGRRTKRERRQEENSSCQTPILHIKCFTTLFYNTKALTDTQCVKSTWLALKQSIHFHSSWGFTETTLYKGRLTQTIKPRLLQQFARTWQEHTVSCPNLIEGVQVCQRIIATVAGQFFMGLTY